MHLARVEISTRLARNNPRCPPRARNRPSCQARITERDYSDVSNLSDIWKRAANLPQRHAWCILIAIDEDRKANRLPERLGRPKANLVYTTGTGPV